MGDDRSLGGGDPPAVHYDEEERPARELRGRVGALVSVVAAGTGVFTLWQVFRPLAQGSQFYLIIFLALTLPLVFLVYKARLRGGERPTWLDWILSGLALIVCLYPLNPFGGGYDGFLDRQALLEPIDVAFGADTSQGQVGAAWCRW